MSYKKAISPVVAIALLLVVSVVAVVGFQGWFQTYQSEVLSNTEQKTSASSGGGITIETISSDGTLYIKNGGNNNVTMSDINLEGTNCDINQELEPGINPIDISSCFVDSEITNVVVVTDSGLIEKKLYTENVEGFSCTTNTPQGFYGGTGSLADPWQICDCIQLQNITMNDMGNFSLISNIDCSDTINWDGGLGFYSIGDGTDPFRSGNFEGNNYVISDLYINRSGVSYIGLFERTYAPFSLSNLRMENVNINGGRGIASICGECAGTFINIHVSNALINSTGAGVGGLFGYIDSASLSDSSFIGTVISTGNAGGIAEETGDFDIFNTYVIANVNGGSRVGGLVGRSDDTGNIINNSYSMGTINGSTYVGGLVGNPTSNVQILNSYSTADVSGSDYVGGLIGSLGGTITNSFSTGNVSGPGEYTGGIVGYNSGTLTNCYWNNHTGNPTYWYGGDVAAQSATEIADDETWFYSNSNAPLNSWDTNVWNFGASYPTLK